MKTSFIPFLSLACAAALALSGAPVLAQSTNQAVVSTTNNAKALNLAGVSTFWTEERFRNAKPLPLPQAASTGLSHDAAVADRSVATPALAVDGHAPTVAMNAAAQQLFAPAAASAQTSGTAALAAAVDSALSGGVTPQDVGTFGAYYTSTRVFPLYTGTYATLSADRTYPYRAVGILFFNINGAGYLCSASVIQRRVVATAGHCVHSGGSAGFYRDFVFVPAYRNGTAPYLSWNWSFATTTATWAYGGGGVPNAADYAMIEFADQPLSRGGVAQKLGNVTGWLGWQTLSLAANHTSKLGYPCNLDSCGVMQDITSGSFRTTSPNNVEYGSDARGGSSGGPWVQNFETLSVGGGTGLNAGSNRVVGVTSYGYVDSGPKVQGASILDSRWIALWNVICARAGNCS